jgi:hypothetical protein
LVVILDLINYDKCGLVAKFAFYPPEYATYDDLVHYLAYSAFPENETKWYAYVVPRKLFFGMDQF